MGKRAWAITAVSGLLTVACGITAVVAAQHRSEAEHRQAAEEQVVNTTDLAALRSELDAQHDTQARLDNRAEALSALFTPDAINAVAQVQADALPGACALARTATRDATPPPNAESYAAYAIAATTSPALDGLPDRWGRMVDPTQIQAEIDRCTTDEQGHHRRRSRAAILWGPTLPRGLLPHSGRDRRREPDRGAMRRWALRPGGRRWHRLRGAVPNPRPQYLRRVPRRCAERRPTADVG